jgi:glyoxylase-like metal-dependent hydrolase (beta-lactamase superfamily II)
MTPASTRFAALVLTIGAVVALPAVAVAQEEPVDEPFEAHDEALAYLGGDALTALAAFTIDASGTRTAIDEGPTPGSLPGVDAPYESQITIDIAGDRMRLDNIISTPNFGIEDRAVAEVITGDTGFIDGRFNNIAEPGTIPMLPDRLSSIRLHQQLLNPHLLVLEVLEDPSIATPLDDVEIDGTNHHAIEIAHGSTPITLLVDHETGQPRQATHMESDTLRRDTEVVVTYADWSSDPIPFPGTVTVTYDGLVVQEESRAVSTDATIDEAMFMTPEGVEAAPADPALAERGDVRHQLLQNLAGIGFPLDGQVASVTAEELAPGVHHVLGGSHHSLAVIQDAGVVIVDAPRDEVQAAAIMEWLGTVTDLPVTHVIQSHHHIDHSGGFRSLVGSNAAVAVVGEPAVAFYEAEVFGAPSEIVPVEGAPAEIMGVSTEVTTIGSGTNPVNVVGFPNPHADDYVLVEAGGVLFTVDIYSPGTGGAPSPELVEAVNGLGLAVTTVAGGHGASEPWPSS